MNFLAHLHLSGNNDFIKIGNFIADSVKGNSYRNFHLEIQKGILLHRKIDEFTDLHPLTKEINTYFAPKYRKYAGIVTDIVYDYYLANSWDLYSEIKYEDFVADAYELLMQNFRILPLRIKKILPFFIGKNRLMSYKNIEGIRSVLSAMAKYTSLPLASDFAIDTVKNNHNFFEERFHIFYAELLVYVKKNEL
ncbi:MAG: ACP phosphodiesterase [Bacteroidales bacterium]|nr:ACP phosphodiesterase [Bacteroidales bacterium]